MKALQIVPFPVPTPARSGGQVRVTACALALDRLGYSVERATVYGKHPTDPETAQGVVAAAYPVVLDWWSRQRRSHLGRPSGLGQLRQMWAFARPTRSAAELARRLKQPVEVLQVEHPWDFDLAWQLRAHEPCARAVLIYSAHNIESDLQEAIWRAQGDWTRAAQRLAVRIREHEASCARRADLCLATSESDARTLRGFGARRVLVVPNGVDPLAPRRDGVALPAARYFIFVASDFPPNVSGFEQFMPPERIAALPGGCAIALAGTVGRAIVRRGRYADAVAHGRLTELGFVERDHLDQLIRHADGVILPIAEGGGTNLKTAEALLSQRPIVASPHSMRGFESFATRPWVHMAADQAAFSSQVESLLREPRHPDADDPAATALTWESAFSGLGPALAELRATEGRGA